MADNSIPDAGIGGSRVLALVRDSALVHVRGVGDDDNSQRVQVASLTERAGIGRTLEFVGGTSGSPMSSYRREKTAVRWPHLCGGGCDLDRLHRFVPALLDTSEPAIVSLNGHHDCHTNT